MLLENIDPHHPRIPPAALLATAELIMSGVKGDLKAQATESNSQTKGN